jgi:tetratricopeptide (TPR) repeat protein
MRAFLVIFSLLLVATTAANVRAEEAVEQAKAAFFEGKQLFEQGEYAAAADAFRRAHAIKPNWKVLYNIGQSETAAKRYGLAIHAFERYLAESGDEIDVARRDEVLAEVERLRKMVGSIEVRAPEGALLTVDGVERGRVPLPGLVLASAGVEHRVVVTHQGADLVDRVVVLTGGQEILIESEAAPDAAEPLVEEEPEPVPEPEDEEPGSALRTAGWVSLSLGAAAVIAGAVTGSMVLELNKELDQDCPDNMCPPEKRDDRDRLNALAPTTDVLLGVGAAAAAAGIIMLIVSADGDEEEDVALVPNGPGVSIVGRF